MPSVANELLDVIEFHQKLPVPITCIILGTEAYYEMLKDGLATSGIASRVYGFPVKIDKEKPWRVACEVELSNPDREPS